MDKPADITRYEEICVILHHIRYTNNTLKIPLVAFSGFGCDRSNVFIIAVHEKT